MLLAAQSEFFENGYRATSMRRIAARANCVVSALYTHWSTKQELFSAVIEPLQSEADALWASISERQIAMQQQKSVTNPDPNALPDATPQEDLTVRLVSEVLDHRNNLKVLYTCTADGPCPDPVESALAVGVIETDHELTAFGFDSSAMSSELKRILMMPIFKLLMDSILTDRPKNLVLADARLLARYSRVGWDALFAVLPRLSDTESSSEDSTMQPPL